MIFLNIEVYIFAKYILVRNNSDIIILRMRRQTPKIFYFRYFESNQCDILKFEQMVTSFRLRC